MEKICHYVKVNISARRLPPQIGPSRQEMFILQSTLKQKQWLTFRCSRIPLVPASSWKPEKPTVKSCENSSVAQIRSINLTIQTNSLQNIDFVRPCSTTVRPVQWQLPFEHIKILANENRPPDGDVLWLVVLPDIAGDAVPAEAPRVSGLRGVAGATVVPAAGQVRVLANKIERLVNRLKKEVFFRACLY